MKPDFLSLAVTSVKRFRSAFVTLLDMHQALLCHAQIGLKNTTTRRWDGEKRV
jgi:hypothetical protein